MGEPEGVNPYRAPTALVLTPQGASDVVPAAAARKAENLVRDSRLAWGVALVPPLGLIFIARLVQWYLLRGRYPALAAARSGEDGERASAFRRALPRLWFAVGFWPVSMALLFGVIALG